MRKKILDNLTESDLAVSPELKKILDRYNLPALEANIEMALKSPDQNFSNLVLQTLKKLHKEIGELCKKKKVPFYIHGARIAQGEYIKVFLLPSNEEKICNIIGYNIFLVETEIINTMGCHAITLKGSIARQDAQAEEGT